MSGGHSARDLLSIVRRFHNRESALRETVPESLSLQDLRNGEEDSFVIPEVVDGEDVGMRETSNCLSFPLESRRRLWILQQVDRKNLEGDLAPQSGVSRAVDFAHSALAEQIDDLVLGETLSDQAVLLERLERTSLLVEVMS
jgi:hypothetical protein